MTAVATVLLVALILGWNALGLGDGGGGMPPESTPPPADITAESTGPITSPKSGTAERTALMDAARVHLGIQDKFVVKGLFVQGDRAVGVLNPDGSSEYHLLGWVRSGGKWTATWNGAPDAAGRAALEKAEPSLSADLIAKLGF